MKIFKGILITIFLPCFAILAVVGITFGLMLTFFIQNSNEPEDLDVSDE